MDSYHSTKGGHHAESQHPDACVCVCAGRGNFFALRNNVAGSGTTCKQSTEILSYVFSNKFSGINSRSAHDVQGAGRPANYVQMM